MSDYGGAAGGEASCCLYGSTVSAFAVRDPRLTVELPPSGNQRQGRTMKQRLIGLAMSVLSLLTSPAWL